MKRTEIVMRGAKLLVGAENAVDRALIDMANLASELGQMRLDAQLSGVLGQEALTELAKGYKFMTKARGAVLRVHHHLDGVKTQIGCGATKLEGMGEGKPGDDTPLLPATGGLRVVSDAKRTG